MAVHDRACARAAVAVDTASLAAAWDEGYATGEDFVGPRDYANPYRAAVAADPADTTR